MEKKQTLPKLKELVSDVGIYDKHDQLNFLLNQEPPANWIKVHPYIKSHKYVPIDKIEYLLRKIFKKYKIEILREGTSFNGVYVVIRLHYLDFITHEWDYHDGIGSIHLQTKKGSSPADLNNINNGALSMAFPLAKTLAIKDAADMFGKLFGADLNRRDTLPASMDAPDLTQEELDLKAVEDRILNHINTSKTTEQLRQVVSEIGDDQHLWGLYNNKFDKLSK